MPSASTSKRSAEGLISIGFKDFACWRQEGECLAYAVDGAADKAREDAPNALYAFVEGEKVLYIGKTTRGLKRRFRTYCKPGASQSTNKKCNKNIRDALAENRNIRIFLFVPVEHLQYGDFPINLAAGLEDSLIREFKPEWNGSRGGQYISETEAAEKETEEEAITPVVLEQKERVRFQITLKDTYFNQGIINPGKSMDSFLGEDGEVIIVYLGDENSAIQSKINKTANPSGSVRIVGENRKIASWFQSNFAIGDTVNAEILDKHHILLKAA